MNLRQNIIDNILECEVKIGRGDYPVTFYYPAEELMDLLGCSKDNILANIDMFKKEAAGEFGYVTIVPCNGNGERFAVTVLPDGVNRICNNNQASDFIRSFIIEIKRPQNTLEDMVLFFKSFDDGVIVEKESDDEWAIFFENEDIDPYVYYIEKNVFGLEYHRFTYSAYERLKSRGL